MMGSGSAASADPLSGMIALIGDPEAAKETLKELRDAKAALSETEAKLVQESEALGKRAVELEAETAALDSRERSIASKEKVLAKRAGEIEAARQDLADKVAAHEGAVSAWKASVDVAKDDIKSARAELRRERTALGKEIKEAEAAKIEAADLMAQAQAAMEAADAMKADYDAKLLRLAEIVKG